MSLFGFAFAGPPLVLGLITGMLYGILAVGLVLIYRSNRIINFAHGAIGAFGASVLGVAVVKGHLPYWVAFPLALLTSATIGAASEFAVVRRLRSAPSLMTMVATLGLAQFLLLMSLVVNSSVGAGASYPQPAFLPEFSVGTLRINRAYFGMLFLTPLVVLGLTLFLRRSRFGLAIRGSADNPEAARLMGVFSNRMSTLAWAIAGAIAAFTAILVLPTQGFTSTDALGPALLLRALVPAVIARMTSLPIALIAGLGVGVVEQLLLWNYPLGGLVEMMLFVGIVGVLLVQRRRGGRDEDKGSWAMVQPWPPLPDALRAVWSVRHLDRFVVLVALIAAFLLPIRVTSHSTVILIAIIGYSIVGLSVGVVTGLGGQLSLGQFALAGIGGTASYWIMDSTGNVLLALAGAGAAGTVASILIGLPALRIRGLMLGVTTLSFAVMTESWLLQQPWMLSGGVNPRKPHVGSFQIDTAKRYYYFALVVLLLAGFVARNVWAKGIGRRLIALRDNEEGARAFGISATFVKLQGFALGGFLAGIGGAVFTHAISRASSTTFPASASIGLVAMSVLGGIGLVSGPIIGALYIFGLPAFLPLDSAELAASSLGWLLLILYFPGGIPQLLRPVRDLVVNLLARRAGVDPVAARAHGGDVGADVGSAGAGLPQRVEGGLPGGTVLKAVGVRKQFGGLTAVNDMSLSVEAGETLGIIGPNGAGKTTLFELLGGFTRADSGQVVFGGWDVTSAAPETRARLGLIRSFQDAALFPTMTVLDTVKLSLERRLPTRFLPALVGAGATERRRDRRARELVHLMGLDAFRHRQIAELSTGTRRITEIACLVALEPTLLLLDEPSSGIAQRETEALGEVLARLRDALGLTMIIIEHDMPLIMGLADRIVAMESGSFLAEGTPEQIQRNPLVIASYLGGDVRTIERSGRVSAAPHAASNGHHALNGAQCTEITRSGAQCTKRMVAAGVCAQHLRQRELTEGAQRR